MIESEPELTPCNQPRFHVYVDADKLLQTLKVGIWLDNADIEAHSWPGDAGAAPIHPPQPRRPGKDSS